MVESLRYGSFNGEWLVMGDREVFLSRGAAILHDLLMIPAAWMLSYWFRFNLEPIPEHFLNSAVDYLWLVIPMQALCFRFFGLYRGVWRFASMPDLRRIVNGVFVGVVVVLAALFVFYRLENVPRSVPFLYVFLLVGLLSGPRFLYRWKKDRHFYLSTGKRVLIVGAGFAGEMLARELLRDSAKIYSPVAFVDDDSSKLGRDLHGIPVVNGCENIVSVADRYAIDLIILAVTAAKTSEKQRVIELCEKSGVPFWTMPQLSEVMSGQVTVNQLRKVSIEDLLGREPVKLDTARIRSQLTNKVIMVTGAGGSIGSELCRQIAKQGPASIILVENGEFNLYSIEMEILNDYPELKTYGYLRDVRDAEGVDRLFESARPDIIFHAAAYKHVPLLEEQPREAAYNNVLGTRNMADASDRYGVEQFVMISTDKAVNPTNIMGVTKRTAEIYCQNLNKRSKTLFSTVRFGNVLGSAGSVVPLFQKQIEKGGPVTVTHPDMERFFMTIPEACQLITQASVLGKGGEIFVLDMGKPIKIQYLAEQMIKLSGKEPGEDIEITYSGLRPGEKLYEELFHEQEKMATTPHEQILLAQHRSIEWSDVMEHLNRMEAAVISFDETELIEQLCWFVPENRLSMADSRTRLVS